MAVMGWIAGVVAAGSILIAIPGEQGFALSFALGASLGFIGSVAGRRRP